MWWRVQRASHDHARFHERASVANCAHGVLANSSGPDRDRR
jgi:hypothetical protein